MIEGLSRQLLRSLRVGRLAYLGWYAPKGAMQRYRKEGFVNLTLAGIGRRQLEALAWRLPTARLGGPDAVRLHIVTGRMFAEQSAVCAWSLADVAQGEVSFTFVDDGTLSSQQVALLGRLFPGSHYRSPRAIEDALDHSLPREQFPALRALRLIYPHIRKITDVHSEGHDWKLVLDSDMIFYQRPDWMLDWLKAPSRPCHMLDVADAYGYSLALLQRIAGAELPSRVNVGLCGLHSAAIDWSRLEIWTARILAEAGRHYLLEQGLTAMIMAGMNPQVAPEEEYIVRPTRHDTLLPRGTLHHYVAESKAWYFRDAWRHVNARANAARNL